jgi:hypothetical protein
VNGTTNRRLIRRVLIVSVFACLTLVAAAPMANADPCPPLDLSCTIQDTTTTAGQVLEDTTTTAGQVLDDTTTTAGQVLEDTTTTAGQVLDDTTTTVGEVLDDTTTTVGGVVGGGGPVVGGLPGVPPGTGGQPSQGGSDPPADQPVPPGGGSPGGGDDTQVGPSTGTQAGPLGPAVGPGLVAATSIEAGVDAGITGRSHVRFLDGGLGSLPSGAWLARTLAFPMFLIMLVIGFVLVQDRIDRRDPKLALAPVGADQLTFS